MIGLRLSGRVVSQRKGIGLDGVKAVKQRVGGRATTTGGMAVELQVTGKVTAQQLQYDLAKGRQQGNMSAEGRLDSALVATMLGCGSEASEAGRRHGGEHISHAKIHLCPSI